MCSKYWVTIKMYLLMGKEWESTDPSGFLLPVPILPILLIIKLKKSADYVNVLSVVRSGQLFS